MLTKWLVKTVCEMVKNYRFVKLIVCPKNRQLVDGHDAELLQL